MPSDFSRRRVYEFQWVCQWRRKKKTKCANCTHHYHHHHHHSPLWALICFWFIHTFSLLEQRGERKKMVALRLGTLPRWISIHPFLLSVGKPSLSWGDQSRTMWPLSQSYIDYDRLIVFASGWGHFWATRTKIVKNETRPRLLIFGASGRELHYYGEEKELDFNHSHWLARTRTRDSFKNNHSFIGHHHHHRDQSQWKVKRRGWWWWSLITIIINWIYTAVEWRAYGVGIHLNYHHQGKIKNDANELSMHSPSLSFILPLRPKGQDSRPAITRLCGQVIWAYAQSRPKRRVAVVLNGATTAISRARLTVDLIQTAVFCCCCYHHQIIVMSYCCNNLSIPQPP